MIRVAFIFGLLALASIASAYDGGAYSYMAKQFNATHSLDKFGASLLIDGRVYTDCQRGPASFRDFLPGGKEACITLSRSFISVMPMKEATERALIAVGKVPSKCDIRGIAQTLASDRSGDMLATEVTVVKAYELKNCVALPSKAAILQTLTELGEGNLD